MFLFFLIRCKVTKISPFHQILTQKLVLQPLSLFPLPSSLKMLTISNFLDITLAENPVALKKLGFGLKYAKFESFSHLADNQSVNFSRPSKPTLPTLKNRPKMPKMMHFSSISS